MIQLKVGAADLRRVRFAFSPIRETVMSLRALASAGQGSHLHRPWLSAVGVSLARLDPDDLALLAALVRPRGYIPDFLAPPPRRRSATFAHELDAVRQGDPHVVADQLLHLVTDGVTQQGAGQQARVRLIRSLIARPDAGVAAIAETLERYHEAAIAPYWSRVRSLLQDDIAYRLQVLADGGFDEMLRDLHPSVSFHSDTIRVVKYYDGTADLGGRGLLLIPSAFSWPDAIVGVDEMHMPALSYSPRGVGRLWEQQPGRADAALVEVIGRTRAALLAQLDLPMSTTQAATQLALSAPSLNAHLKALQRAGLLTSHREGRKVLYARTDLGDRLLAGPES